MRLSVIILMLILSGTTGFAGNHPEKAVNSIDKVEPAEQKLSGVFFKNNSSVLIGNSANGFAWQASGTNQIYYDAVSQTIGVIKRRGSLDTEIPFGSGRIVTHQSTDEGANWTAGLEMNGTLSQQMGRHPNIAILPSGELISLWTELINFEFRGLGMAVSGTSDGSSVSVYLSEGLIAEIDDVAGLDTAGYGVPDEIFVDEKNGTFYFGGGIINETYTPYLFKSSDKGKTHDLVKLWKNASNGGFVAGGNPSHGDFFNDYGNFIMSINPDSAYAVKNGLDYSRYYPYLVRFENGSIAEEGFIDIDDVFAASGVDAWEYDFDVVTDRNGNWHLFIQAFKSGTPSANAGIYEIYSNTPSLTDFNIVKVADITLTTFLIDTEYNLYGHADIHAARDAEGKYVFVKYLDWDPTDEPETSTEIYLSGRAISDTRYTKPIAVNQNDQVSQFFTQTAPRVTSLGAGDASGTEKFRIHTTWVEFGGPLNTISDPSNIYYVGPTLDVRKYSPGDRAVLTFKVNTAFVQDTLSASSSVTIRGDGIFGDGSATNGNGVVLKNVAGDYWVGSITVPVGESGSFKPVTATSSGTGWDSHLYSGTTIGGDTTITIFATGLKERYSDPFTGNEITRGDDWNPLTTAKNGNNDVYAVNFRVNTQFIPGFDPEIHTVAVRGSFNGWSPADTLKPEVPHHDLVNYEADKYFYSKTILIPKTSAGVHEYKFVLSDEETTTWEDLIDGNRIFKLTGDTTLAWKWFNNLPPEESVAQYYLSVPNLLVSEGTTQIQVPVYFATDGFPVSSAHIEFSGFMNRLQFENISTAGTLFEKYNWTYTMNNQGSLVITSAAGAQSIKENGVLFYLNFQVSEASTCFFSPIVLGNITFDTGNNKVESTNGSVYTSMVSLFGDADQNGNVQAFDAAIILKSLAGNLTLDCAGFSNSDVTLDGKVTALDAAAILLYDAKIMAALPMDSSLVPLMKAKGSIAMNNLTMSPDAKSVSVPLTLYEGKNILSFEMQFNYNPDLVIYEKVNWSSEFTGFLKEIKNDTENGTLTIVGANSLPFDSEGNIGSIEFSVKHAQPSKIELKKLRFNESEMSTDVAASDMKVVTSVDDQAVTSFALYQNYPNPFNPVTTISFDLPLTGEVEISVFNLVGAKVGAVVQQNLPAGRHEFSFDASGLASGVYFYQLRANNFIQTRKLTVLK